MKPEDPLEIKSTVKQEAQSKHSVRGSAIITLSGFSAGRNHFVSPAKLSPRRKRAASYFLPRNFTVLPQHQDNPHTTPVPQAGPAGWAQGAHGGTWGVGPWGSKGWGVRRRSQADGAQSITSGTLPKAEASRDPPPAGF